MIPKFPEFKKLEYSDKSEINKIVDRYPPYSDFNFISMWSWNNEDGTEISNLNDNLVVRFTDYITDEPFYSFIGDTRIEETTVELLKLSADRGLSIRLKLIPEVVADKIAPDSGLIVSEDLGNFDYMYQLEKLKSYDGNKLRGKRNLSTRYKKNYLEATQIKILNPVDPVEKREILDLLGVWEKNKEKDVNKNEFLAIYKAMNIEEPQNLLFVGLFINEVLVGFVINEILKDQYAILHFEKADLNYVGIYSYLMQKNAEILYNFGQRVLNYEQDLDLPGLRLAKKAYYPSHHLKKYVITTNPHSTVANVA